MRPLGRKIVVPRASSPAVTVIKQEDFIQSIADALQYISYYHPADYIENLAKAYEREESVAAKDAIAQILINSRMCAEGHRPICQDTGIVTVFLEVGMNVRWESTLSVDEMVNEGFQIFRSRVAVVYIIRVFPYVAAQ